MVDRIAEPWGDRTPYAPGDSWPVRVDGLLEEGVTETEVERWVQAASILHSNGDGIDIAVKGGRIVGVRGRRTTAPTTGGWIPRASTAGRPTAPRTG
jgi:hypothetical protein